MPTAPPVLFFDYVDPLCYLLDLELKEALGEGVGGRVTRVPVEVCSPPAPLLDPEGPWWTTRWEAAAPLAEALCVPLVEPRILPWTRKAHELALHAGDRDRGEEAHAAVFQAIFGRGEDIGRVDVLVEVARQVGLDPQEAKAVLDVDRYAAEVDAFAVRARDAGVDDIPVLVRGGESLQGFHNRDTLRTFLLR
jgi:predicted DsbA family dithiol-disulfide isomerase